LKFMFVNEATVSLPAGFCDGGSHRLRIPTRNTYNTNNIKMPITMRQISGGSSDGFKSLYE
jgi:hypothetical protein